ncbi:sensor histidine kinase [Deinococcus yavapaiensis]|uniref:histidine kinase n=1 Tax=Deinococcus yavapaiensis KR-236 TaxID=694435 RepID=A0A318S5G7_9DEIO|nr:ATP-binding protein [Deinococcus yavapaiensis]PYE48684.1 PAS domain S-box-containing protein [Deinococcus yavapaiensis KR-236]
MVPDPRALLEAVREVIVHLDAAERITYVNAEGADFLGLDPNDLTGRSLWDVVPEAASSPIEIAVREAARSGAPRSFEGRDRVSGRWLDVAAYPTTNGVLLRVRDIHEQKSTEERAHRLGAVTEALAGAATTAEIVDVLLAAALPATLAEAGAVLRALPDGSVRLLGQYGYPDDVASLFEHSRPAEPSPLTDALRERMGVYLAHEEVATRYPNLANDEIARRPAFHVVVPLVTSSDAMGAWQLTFPASTKLTESDRAFVETLARLAALALARGLLHDAMEDTIAARTKAVATQAAEMRAYADAVTRDLLPPVRRIRSFTELVVRRVGDELPEREARYLEYVRAESERATHLLTALATFVTSGQDSLQRTNVPLGRLAVDVRADLAPLVGSRSVAWTFRDLPTVRGDATLLRQVFAALLSNALKFTETRSVALIEVGAERRDDTWHVSVNDNGVGFPTAHLDALSSANGDLPSSSLGVGLATVRRIVVKHGGIVWAENLPEGGATVHFTLPDEPRNG